MEEKKQKVMYDIADIYCTPEVKVISICVRSVIVASGEGETGGDEPFG